MDVQVLDDIDEQVGHAQYVCVQANGVLSAAADPRSDGTVATAV